jgi:hypothetical protein
VEFWVLNLVMGNVNKWKNTGDPTTIQMLGITSVGVRCTASERKIVGPMFFEETIILTALFG